MKSSRVTGNANPSIPAPKPEKPLLKLKVNVELGPSVLRVGTTICTVPPPLGLAGVTLDI